MDKYQIMQQLSDKIGINVAFNDMGLARLRFDKTFIVDFEVADDERSMFIYSSLGYVPDGQKGTDLLRKAMKAHYLGRRTGLLRFGLDNGSLIAFVHYDFAFAKDNDLYTLLEDFLDIVSEYACLIKDIQ